MPPMLVSLTAVYALAAFRWLWETGIPTGAPMLHAIWTHAADLALITLRVVRG